MATKVGIRCLKCNTDVYVSELEVFTKHCRCGDCSIEMTAGKAVLGHKKGTPYMNLFDNDGKVKVVQPIDTNRAEPTKLDTTHEKRRTIEDLV
jgi:hypothetical protein